MEATRLRLGPRQGWRVLREAETLARRGALREGGEGAGWRGEAGAGTDRKRVGGAEGRGAEEGWRVGAGVDTLPGVATGEDEGIGGGVAHSGDTRLAGEGGGPMSSLRSREGARGGGRERGRELEISWVDSSSSFARQTSPCGANAT